MGSLQNGRILFFTYKSHYVKIYRKYGHSTE